jgi:hypothetical protein
MAAVLDASGDALNADIEDLLFEYIRLAPDKNAVKNIYTPIASSDTAWETGPLV